MKDIFEKRQIDKTSTDVSFWVNDFILLYFENEKKSDAIYFACNNIMFSAINYRLKSPIGGNRCFLFR